jgi:cytochrome c
MSSPWLRPIKIMATAFILTLSVGWTIQDAHAQASTGMAFYQAKCGGCHSLDANRIGPAHRGVVGRKPGSVVGFASSPALKKLGGVWTPARLDAWLQGPQKLAPGSKMFLTVTDPAARSAIIGYLASVSSPIAARRK